MGSWKFTYQDRIHSFEDLDFIQGCAALSDYAGLYGRLERELFARSCAGVPLPSLKKGCLSKERIPARMFNSLRVSVEGKVSAARESQLGLVESLGRRIVRAEKQIAVALDDGRLNAAHHKKRRLANLGHRLAVAKSDIAEGRVRVCFGSRRLWRSQHNLSENGYGSHEEWKRDWRDARSDEFFVLGSKDEKAGCQLCVATVQDDGSLTLRLRLPDALGEEHGKYLVMPGIHFNHGHAEVLDALEGEDRRAISYRFKRDGKGWRVFASVKRQGGAGGD